MKRITAPKFKVGRYVLNEYEVRNLQVETALGLIVPYSLTIKEIDPKTRKVIGSTQMREDGTFTNILEGFGLATSFTFDLIRLKREIYTKEEIMGKYLK